MKDKVSHINIINNDKHKIKDFITTQPYFVNIIIWIKIPLAHCVFIKISLIFNMFINKYLILLLYSILLILKIT